MVETLVYEQRGQRLAASAWVLARLDEVIRLVACAYGIRVAWMPDEYTKEAIQSILAMDALTLLKAQAEQRVIVARLASAGHAPLVIGDPLRRTLWLARRPFAHVMRRVRTGPMPLERVVSCAQQFEHIEHIEGIERIEHANSTASASAASLTPAQQLAARCGPAGRVLLAQTDALLEIAPRVASCPPAQWSSRYVLAAPYGIYSLQADSMLTSWSERLLCLPLGAGVVATSQHVRVASLRQ